MTDLHVHHALISNHLHAGYPLLYQYVQVPGTETAAHIAVCPKWAFCNGQLQWNLPCSHSTHAHHQYMCKPVAENMCKP